MVFIRGDEAIQDLLAQSDAVEGWWPDGVRQLLGMRSLANRSGADHKARRRVVGQLFSKAALNTIPLRSWPWSTIWLSRCQERASPQPSPNACGSLLFQ